MSHVPIWTARSIWEGVRRLGSRRLGLRTALVLYVLVPVVAAMSLAAFLAVTTLEGHMERRMQEDVELVARTLQRPLSRALERGRSGAVQNALDSAFRIDRVFGAYVYDADGRTVAVAGREEALPGRRRLSELAAEGERTGEYGEVAGRHVYSYFVPLSDSGGRVAALLQVTRRGSDFEAYFRNLRWQAGGLLIASWLAVGALVLVGHRKVAVRPLDQLLDSMGRIARGERDHRAQVDGPWELEGLARRMNSMLDSIGEAEREIAARRRKETALREELRYTERLAALGRLSAGVAHELGSPLSVISGRVQRALRNQGPNAPVSPVLKEIEGQVRRMEAVVRQLLDFGRREVPERRLVDVARVCRAATVAVQDLAKERSVSIELDGAQEGILVYADAGRLERVLINLLRNAIQASAAGRARLAWAATDSELRLAVEDDGPGVPEEDRGRVFEPFFTTKRPGKGSGLGLAVVHGVVEELGGSIQVGDGALGGARFEARIPRRARHRQEGP